jgi:hypothetical protein
MVGALGDVRCCRLEISISSISFFQFGVLLAFRRLMSAEANLGFGKCWLALFESLVIIISLVCDIMEVAVM